MDRIIYMDTADSNETQAALKLLEEFPEAKLWTVLSNVAPDSTPFQWAPGTLSGTQVRRIMQDALADIWRDSWRQSDALAVAARGPSNQGGRFCGVVEALIYAATGKRARVELVP